MKKIKLNTSSLKLKKEEISNLTSNEMKHVLGGNPALTQPPICNGTYPCIDSIDQNCPPPTDPPETMPGQLPIPTVASHHC